MSPSIFIHVILGIPGTACVTNIPSHDYNTKNLVKSCRIQVDLAALLI